MHEYYVIKKEAVKILSDAGYSEESEDVHPDYFGSIHTIFAKGNKKVRLVWDGKDGWGFAQTLEGTQWEDIEVYVPESREKEFMENIQLLCVALREAITRG
jgi:hypothetical protein